VNYTSVFRWSIAMLIVPTVAWKIAASPVSSNDLKEGLVTFLERNSFTVIAADKMINADLLLTYVPTIQATKSSCRLLITRLNFDGSNLQLVKSRLASTDRQFVIFRGKIYDSQPISLTLANYFKSRFLSLLGLPHRAAPTIAVGSNSSCDADRLRWEDLPW
jgi:hypothetical protein